jgi:hypothetical protein
LLSPGIKIGTIDNPGWRITINVWGTELQDIPFEEVSHGLSEEEEIWWHRKKEKSSFQAACSPTNFNKVITIFNEWVSAVSGR